MKPNQVLTRVIATGVCATLLTSCASIFSGGHQSVRINSQPPGAAVTIDGTPSGTTPTTATLSRKTSHRVGISLKGFKPYEVTLEQKFNAWVLGNILIGGIIGIAIDNSTGAAYVLTPGQIDAALQSGKLSVIERRDTLVVATVLKPEPGWRTIGRLTRS